MIGIAFVYFLASTISIVAFGFLIYELVICDSYDMNGFRAFDHRVSSIEFMIVCGLLTFGVLLLCCRLLRLHKLQVPLDKGRNSLFKYYAIFMLGYLTHVASDYVINSEYLNNMFDEEMLYDWSALMQDFFPIMALLVFHYKNFKPHQHQLIIRINNNTENQIISDGMSMDSDENPRESMQFIQDGMLGPVRISRDSVVVSSASISGGLPTSAHNSQ